MQRSRSLFVLVCAAVSVCTPARAGFTADPAVNSPIAAYTLKQMRPSVSPVPFPDGGWYVVWHDDGPSGPYPTWPVIRLLRITENGDSAWYGATLIVQFPAWTLDASTSTDIDLDTGPTGDAYLAFQDERTEPHGIAVARVDVFGTHRWNGAVALLGAGETGSFPKIAGVPDGGAVALWTDTSGELRVRGLAADGTVRWQQALVAPTGRRHRALDVVSDAQGAVTITFLRERITPREADVRVLRLSATGAPAWTPSSVLVSDTARVSAGDPSSIGDGRGGVAIAWCSTASRCFVQHVRADGTERFGADGVPVTETWPTLEDRAALAFKAGAVPGADEFVAFWRATAGGPWGARAQLVTGAGTRDWGPGGVEVAAPSTRGVIETWVHASGTGYLALWRDEFNPQDAGAWFARIDRDGTRACAEGRVTFGKPFFFRAAASPTGRVNAVWQRDDAYQADIVEQDVNADCLLGLPVVPEEAWNVRFDGATTLAWDPAPYDHGWSNVYRGDLAALHDGSGGACLQSEVWGSTHPVPDAPVPPGGWFYVVSSENTAGEGSLGRGSSGIERTPETRCP